MKQIKKEIDRGMMENNVTLMCLCIFNTEIEGCILKVKLL